MKQMIILLAMIILGIAISAMVLSFQGTTQSLTDSAHQGREMCMPKAAHQGEATRSLRRTP